MRCRLSWGVEPLLTTKSGCIVRTLHLLLPLGKGVGATTTLYEGIKPRLVRYLEMPPAVQMPIVKLVQRLAETRHPCSLQTLEVRHKCALA